MGKILCERHGGSPIAFVCDHLAAELCAQRAVGPHAGYVVELDGREILRHQYCPACVERLGLPTPPRPLNFEERDLPASPVCARCYRDAVGR